MAARARTRSGAIKATTCCSATVTTTCSTAGVGDDTMGGGQGTDVFVFETESGSDVISDFDTAAGEVLDFTRLGFDEDFAAFKAGRIDENADGDAVVDLGGDNKIVLLGVGVDDLQASHFTLV